MDHRLSLGHSPDADDAFMFYGISTGKIKGKSVSFVEELHDIETLSKRAAQGTIDITAVSAAAYPSIQDKYLLLSHGASCGEGYGPVLIRKAGDFSADPAKSVVAIPGEKTTAALALRLRYPGIKTDVVPFDQIMDAVSTGTYKLGLIIHEGQLTYQDKGFESVCDLGVWWQGETKTPLVLGLNAIRRGLSPEVLRECDELLESSIRYALEHRDEAMTFAMKYSGGLPRALADKFVGMYVNGLTRNLGEAGRKGLSLLYERGIQAGFLPKSAKPEFVRG